MSTTAILITNYNNAPWIRACVDSALAQTRPADEVVVFDDGSDDGSLDLLRGYGDRICLIEGRREQGPARKIERQAVGVEAGLRACTARHVHLLDGDDVYASDRIEAYEAGWAAHPRAAMVQARLRMIDVEGNPVGAWKVEAPTGTQDLAGLIRSTGDPGRFYVSSALAFDRTVLEAALPMDFSDNLPVGIDTRLAFEAALRGPVLTLPMVHTAYRIRTGSMAAETGVRGAARHVETARNLRCFNLAARRLGQPTARVWTSPKWLRQRLRAALPSWCGDRLAAWLDKRRPRASQSNA